MQHLRLTKLAALLWLAVLLGAGCTGTTPPPTPLTAEELPNAFNKAFTQAKPETKTLASQVVSAVQGQDYPKAFAALQSLVNSPGLSKEQQSVTSRATLTVNSLLQAAQAKGDASAAQALEHYRRDK